MNTWEEVAEHYRRAMLMAEQMLNSIPLRAHSVAVSIDPTAQTISAAADALRKARDEASPLYFQSEVPEK